MGNRAVIATEKRELGVYLHWNGGRDSVRPFLMYCKMKDYRAPEEDNYGFARLCQVVGNVFTSGLSVGVGLYDRLDTDNCDNGTYITKEWKIIGREFFEDEEQNEHDPLEFLLHIDVHQPAETQLGAEVIKEKYFQLVAKGY